MDNLAKLQLRKAELAAKIEQQRAAMKGTLLEIREEIEPGKLLKNAISGAFGFGSDDDDKNNSAAGRPLPKPVSILFNLLVKDPRLAFALKMVTPLALKYVPMIGGLIKKKTPATETDALPAKPIKAKFYGKLRQGISTLRGKLRNPTPEKKIELPEN
jgi:hypothetical protein